VGLHGAGALQSGLQVTTHPVCTSAQKDFMVTCTVSLVPPLSFHHLQYLHHKYQPFNHSLNSNVGRTRASTEAAADDPGLSTSTSKGGV